MHAAILKFVARQQYVSTRVMLCMTKIFVFMESTSWERDNRMKGLEDSKD